MELAAASEMSVGYRVDKQPTWHPIWRARYRVAVDCRPEVPVPRSIDRLLPGFVETFCGAGLRPGPAIRTRQRGTIRRFLRLSSHLGGLTLIPTRRAYRQNSTVFVDPGRSRKSDPPPIGGIEDGSLGGDGRFCSRGRCRLVLQRGDVTPHGPVGRLEGDRPA